MARSTVLTALMTIFAVVEAARIRRESDDCDKITLAHEECVKLAYDNYVAAHGAGDDGRGDWEARKSCNYVNSAVGECGDVLSGCYEEDEVDARKDHQVEAILDQLERVVGGWDSSKCPVISEYLERQAGDDEDGEEAADGGQEDEEGVEDGGMYGEEEEDAADEEPSEDDAQEEDGDEGDEEVNGEEGDAEEGDAEEGDAEEVDGGEGEDEEGEESKDVVEGDADAEDNDEDEDAEEGGDEDDEDAEEGGEEEEDAEEGGDEEEEDDESSSPILISSFTMVLTCLLAA